MDRRILRQHLLGPAVNSAVNTLSKHANAGGNTLQKIASHPVVQQLVKTAADYGYRQGMLEGYASGAQDATAHVLAKLAEGDNAVDIPEQTGTGVGGAPDHAMETVEGIQELAAGIGASVNAGDQLVTEGADQDVDPNVEGAGDEGAMMAEPAPEATDGITAEAEAWLESILEKQAGKRWDDAKAAAGRGWKKVTNNKGKAALAAGAAVAAGGGAAYAYKRHKAKKAAQEQNKAASLDDLLMALLDKQAEGEELAEAEMAAAAPTDGTGSENLDPVMPGEDVGGDEFGPYNPDLDPNLARSSTATFEQLVADNIAAAGGLSPA